MGKIWVRAKSIVRIDVDGALTTYHPGDWCRMGRHQANQYLANGQVEILKPDVLRTVQDLTDCAIYLRSHEASKWQDLMLKYPGVPIEKYEEFPERRGRFLIWDMSANLSKELIMTGFGLLKTWQLAVPLLNYSVLAQDVGTAVEREETKAIIHDLRVPIYDSRVIFARQCHEVRHLFELWNGGGELAFLRALYQSRPIINALPPSWILE